MAEQQTKIQDLQEKLSKVSHVYTEQVRSVQLILFHTLFSSIFIF